MRKPAGWLTVEIVAFLSLACTSQPGGAPQVSKAQSNKYLFAWVGDDDEAHSDFLAVVDLRKSAATFGDVIRTVPVGVEATDAHHTEHVFPTGSVLFANGFSSGLTFLFDLTDPLRPTLKKSFTEAGPLRYPHSFERLANGNVVATFQNEGEGNEKTGGLAELDDRGIVRRYSSGYDPDVDPDVRPYSLAVLPAMDRIVTTGADMRGDYLSRSVQIWRLSDLALLQTLPLGEGPGDARAQMTGEPRVLLDGRTVMVATFGCGLYLLEGLNTDSPSHQLVFEFATPDGRCSLSIRSGDYWIQAIPGANMLMALDVSKPTSPKEVSRLLMGEGNFPHWISRNNAGDEIVITGFGSLANRIVLARLNLASGELSIDPDLGLDGIDFSRDEWPHGRTGAGVPHGAVFSY